MLSYLGISLLIALGAVVVMAIGAITFEFVSVRRAARKPALPTGEASRMPMAGRRGKLWHRNDSRWTRDPHLPTQHNDVLELEPNRDLNRQHIRNQQKEERQLVG